ncbi:MULTISPECIES: pyrroline-5-carboxylate reductase [unclassified Sphingomonas]|uniref:pyrroline-5-carboxylate reductase n=1 Tax=unclassified Sphingomonas TaxID=196159 RepID=UPI0021519CF5|nr:MULTISPECIES: pyrroline-5-carboxylate reductase [unclassified Sphingomonas]MCR5872534.1 pyrroline-5-carboxylate reductase [Sphingomonas sp. J344]UUX99182.1 pyrroline-5-carboxylate reductase [Sphingomonas sp. J315]
MTTPKTLWLIGCGNMAGAMLRRWIAAGTVRGEDVFVLNRGDCDLPQGVRQGRVLPEGALPDAVMLGVKPQQLDGIADQIAARIAGVPMLVSILAGVEEAALAARFDAGAIVRAMPNLPVEIGKGVVALHSDSADAEARAGAEVLMAPLGLVEWVDAARFDAVTALAGSGPAFVYRFVDALAAAGAAVGIPADQALRLALATVEGGALLAARSSETPATLADKVASPGGSTRKGLDVLDTDSALVKLLTATLEASERRNAEMAAAAHG